eukprot:scaffold2.g7187.t1
MRGLITLLAAGLLCAAACRAEIIIESADRTIDGAGFAVQAKTILKIKNSGSTAEPAVVLCEPAVHLANKALYEVVVVSGGKEQALGSAPASPAGAPAGVVCVAFALPAPLAPGATAELRAVAGFTHVLTPKPADIAPTEPQRVLYEGALYLLSPYRVASQTTTFEATTTSILEFSKEVEPAKKKGKKVVFGPYEDVAPFALRPLRVHYENNSPFAQAVSVEREIEISHWGNVYFEDRINLRHAGARVAGEWSRLDYMTDQNYGKNAIRELVAVMPPSARSLYYRDEIGNISTSAARFNRDGVVVSLAPRYPLFGGWTATFVFGYSLPLDQAVLHVGDGSGKLALVTMLGPAVQGLVIDELTIKVVLPEGATGAEAETGIPMDQTFEKKYTYLDVLGRTVVVLRHRNLVPQMGTLPLNVKYSYAPLGLLQKPLVLVSAFASVFLLVLTLSCGNGNDKQHAS